MVIETFVDSVDHPPITGQRDNVLARGYWGGAQTGEVVAGAGGGLDLLGIVLQQGRVGLAGTATEVLDHPEIGPLFLGGVVRGLGPAPG